jgi:hypothetical protein
MPQPLFPKTMNVTKDSLDELDRMLSDAVDDLTDYLESIDANGTINRSQIITARQETQARLQDLGNDLGAWISFNVASQYVQGQQDAARQQSSYGNKEAAGLILGAIAFGKYAKYASGNVMTTAKVISPNPQIFTLQDQSVQNIMQDMSTSFGNTLTYMSRSTDGIISRIQALGIRRAIAEEAAKGTDTSAISKQIADMIRNKGIYGLVDKGGRTWTPENYADMLVKTKLTEARNNGLMNSLLQIGQDLVEVSAHGATDACAAWEGRILSITGRSKLYPSVQDATNAGLFHPRCKHTLNSVPPDTYPEQYLDDSFLLDPASLLAAV